MLCLYASNTGQNLYEKAYSTTHWLAQIFTLDYAATITQISLYCQKTGSPGDLTVSIQKANTSYFATADPLGTDLDSGTITEANIPAAYDWATATLTGIALEPGIYCIVVKALTGDASNYLRWAFLGSDYEYGEGRISTDGGAAWGVGGSPLYPGDDFSFKVYGNPQIADTDPTTNFKLFERYTKNDDATSTVYGDNWMVQTFTPSAPHTCYIVSPALLRVNNCGDVTAAIRAIDDDTESATYGLPTGSDLAYCTLHQSDIGTSADYINFIFYTPIALTQGTAYALVLRAPDGNAANYLGVRIDQTTPEYTAGSTMYSTDGGTTWAAETAYDMLFQEWGVPTVIPTNAVAVYLLPNGEGDYKELGCSNKGKDYDENWECVAKIPGTSGGDKTGVVWSWDSNNFASDNLTGTSIWRSGVAGLSYYKYDPTGYDTIYTTELSAGYFIRSTEQVHTFKVKSIQNDYELTLDRAPAGGHLYPREVCDYYTPKHGGDGDPAMATMDSTSVTFTRGSKTVSGVDTAFTEILWPLDYIRPQSMLRDGVKIGAVVSDTEITLVDNFPYKTRTDEADETFYAAASHIDDEVEYCDPVKQDSYTIKNTLNPSEIIAVNIVYRVGASSWMGGDLPDAATGVLTGTVTFGGTYYGDPCITGSGTIFETQLEAGDYVWRSDEAGVVMKVESVVSDTLAVLKPAVSIAPTTGADTVNSTCYYHPSSNFGGVSPQMCHATPFLRLGGIDQEGTEISFFAQNESEDWATISGKTHKELMSRPGGGVFSWSDLNDLQIGIILESAFECIGNDSFGNYPGVFCTQICLEVVTAPSLTSRRLDNTGYSELGFKVFAVDSQGIDEMGFSVWNGYDEWGREVWFMPWESNPLVGVTYVKDAFKESAVRTARLKPAIKLPTRR